MGKEKLEVAKRLLSERVKTYLPLATSFLLNDLKLPGKLVGLPAELRCYIDGNWTHTFNISGEYIWPMQVSVSSFDPWRPDESACYRPGNGRLMLMLPMIDVDADAAELDSAILTEILIAHECVHVAMMGHLNLSAPGSELDWIQRDDLRFIHEAIAMRFCEKLPDVTDNRISQADVKKYLNYVQFRSDKSPFGAAYARYFTGYSREKDQDLWAALTSDVALITEFAD